FINENEQTTLVPAGDAALFGFKVGALGEYLLVDHSVFRAYGKAALAQLEASADKTDIANKGIIHEGIYAPEGGAIQRMPINEQAVADSKPPEDLSKEQKIELGKNIYGRTCFACHQSAGQGVPGAFPPLAKADYLNADVPRAIDIVMHGKSGEITVNG